MPTEAASFEARFASPTMTVFRGRPAGIRSRRSPAESVIRSSPRKS